MSEKNKTKIALADHTRGLIPASAEAPTVAPRPLSEGVIPATTQAPTVAPRPRPQPQPAPTRSDAPAKSTGAKK